MFSGTRFCARWAAEQKTAPLHLINVVVTTKPHQYIANCASEDGKYTKALPFGMAIDATIPPEPYNFNTMQTIMAVTKKPTEPHVADEMCALVTPIAESEGVKPLSDSRYEISCVVKQTPDRAPQYWRSFKVTIRYQPLPDPQAT